MGFYFTTQSNEPIPFYQTKAVVFITGLAADEDHLPHYQRSWDQPPRANTVVGMVESAVGLVPSGGGVKETYWRWYQATDDWEVAAWKTWMNLGYGATASSPQMAAGLHYFREGHDVQVMNRDRIYNLSVQALDTLGAHYKPPAEPQFQLAGGDILERMNSFMDDGIKRGDFFNHDFRRQKIRPL